MWCWINTVLFLSARSVLQFLLLRALKQEKTQFKMYMGNGENCCSDWVWGKFIFIIRLHSLKLSTYKDEGFLPVWRNMHCIIVSPESFESLMHGHTSALHFIHICVSPGTPTTGELQRITHPSRHLESWTPCYQDFHYSFLELESITCGFIYL